MTPHQRSSYACITLGRARRRRKIAGRIATAEINTGDALGLRQGEKENKTRKREKTEHAMRNPVQGLRTEVLLLLVFFYAYLALFSCAYLALYNKINNSLCYLRFFLFFFFDTFASFSGIICANLTRTRAKRNATAKQTNGERGRWREWGPAAGARVSAATQRTRTSDSGTDVRTTSSPRHDSSDD